MPAVTPQANQLIDFIQTSGVRLLVWTVVALVAYSLIRPLVRRAVVGLLERRRGPGEEARLSVEETRKRLETIEALISKTLRVAVVVLFALVVMAILDLLPAIAGLGLVLAGLAVAGQDIVRDYLMGLLILLEGPYFVGDVVRVGGVEGTVEEIGLRRTILRDLTGTVHSVSNGDIRVASNLTRGYARVVVDVTVAFGTDLERATAVVDEVGQDLAADPEWAPRLLETPALIRIGAFTELGVPLRIGGRVRAQDRFVVLGELRRRVLAAFQQNRIEIPGVHRLVPVRQGPSGPAAPSGPAPDVLEDE